MGKRKKKKNEERKGKGKVSYSEQWISYAKTKTHC